MSAETIARSRLARPVLAGREPDGWRLETLQRREQLAQCERMLRQALDHLAKVAGDDFSAENADHFAESAYWLQQLGFRLNVSLPKDLFRHRVRLERQNV